MKVIAKHCSGSREYPIDVEENSTLEELAQAIASQDPEASAADSFVST